MKNKTLCLYWAQQDKTLNFIVESKRVRVELKFGRYGNESFEMTDTQVAMLMQWLKENER